MVELVGQMKDNLLVDFGIAKKIVKEVLTAFDHKFFINEKYKVSEDDSHYVISFNGPKGMFELQVPKDTTYLLEGEATVENLSSELIKLLAPKMPSNVEAVGVYIYEGYNKGSHIISTIER
jgi:6-pyruvoyltetrahydropterin/6-carboxytetrahydropterin synthase